MPKTHPRARPFALLFALSLVACGGAAAVSPAVACPAGTTLQGGQCVASQVKCPEGSTWQAGACLGAAPPKAAAIPTVPKACSDEPACRTACDRGDARSCGALGTILHAGRGVPADESGAMVAFEKACEGKDPEGCYRVGISGRVGAETKVAHLTLACDAGIPDACADLGFNVERGRGGRTADAVAARALYEKSCKGGSLLGCQNLSIFLTEGTAGPKDLARAVELQRRVCEGGRPSGCTALGSRYDEGQGVDRDLAKARELFRRGCDGDDGTGCNNLGVMYKKGEGVPVDVAHSVTLFERGCDLRNGLACVNLARIRIGGDTGSTNLAAGARLLSRGCELDEQDGCDELPAAVARIKDECDQGDQVECSNQGYIYEYGYGVPKNEPRALELYQRSCTAGGTKGCTNAAMMLDEGRPAKADIAKALALYKLGCKRGDDRACKRIEEIVAGKP